MIRARRIAVVVAALSLGLLGVAGGAYADDNDGGDQAQHDQSAGDYPTDTDPEDTDSSDDSDENGCIPENDHSSPDLYRYPQCPGHRDSRDDEGHPGPENRGGLGFLSGH